MTSDGTNSYSWDAANRLIEIVYPGTGNNSQFSYDGYGRNVQILEYTSGSLTSTKQFVWCGGNRCESRNASSVVLAQYFSRGQTTTGTSYLYTRDHLGSVREMSDSSGTLQAQYGYDSYGRVIKLQGSQSSDFQYASYYAHAPSALNFTMFRAYNPALSRWINRDPIGEAGSINLYSYVANNPINGSDPTGLMDPSDKNGFAFQNNCFGYSCGENRSADHPWGTVNQPDPNESYQDFFDKQHWHCQPQTATSPPCEKRCGDPKNQKCNIVHLFGTTGYTGKGPPDLSNSPNDKVGFHTGGWGVTGFGGISVPSPSGWTQLKPGNSTDSPTAMDEPVGGPSTWCCCKSTFY